MLNRNLCLATVLALTCSLFAGQAPSGGYSVIKKIPIPGQGSWDYLTVDGAARRLYVSHGTQVEVLDIDSLAVVGNIPKTPGVHGIALAPALGRGFVSNGQASTVTIFDLNAKADRGRSDWTEARRNHLRFRDVASLCFQWWKQ